MMKYYYFTYVISIYLCRILDRGYRISLHAEQTYPLLSVNTSGHLETLIGFMNLARAGVERF